MNIDHLGDALDCWKGWVLGTFQDAELISQVRVVPMFTDENVAETWGADQLKLYASLIGVSEACILKPGDRFDAKTRGSYFQDLGAIDDNDMFIDPDTGIEPPSGSNTKHIRLCELARTLPKGSDRMVLVYQHSSREDNWVDACLTRVIGEDSLAGSHTFALWAGSASMVFISRSRERLQKCQSFLDGLMSSLRSHVPRVTEILPSRPSVR